MTFLILNSTELPEYKECFPSHLLNFTDIMLLLSPSSVQVTQRASKLGNALLRQGIIILCRKVSWMLVSFIEQRGGEDVK